MNMELSRRQFMKGAGAGLAGTTLGAFGFGDVEAAYAAAIRPFKLAAPPRPATPAPTARSPAASSCIPRAISRRARRRRSPTSRATSTIRPIAARSARRARRSSTSCIRRRASPSRRLRKPGADKFEEISWNDALDRIARLMKDDRDAELHRQERRRRDGQPVDHHRLPRRLGDHQRDGVPDLQGGPQRRHAGVRQPSAGLTRPHGVQFGPNIWPWRDDEFLDRHSEHGSRRHNGW